MKRMLIWTLAILSIAAIVSPAAAGSFVTDLINVGSGATCGQIVVTGGSGLIVVAFNFTSTSPACIPPVPRAAGAKFDLCRLNLSGTPVFLTSLTDTDNNGRINGTEGIKNGTLVSGNVATRFEVWSSTDTSCSGTLEFVSGYTKP